MRQAKAINAHAELLLSGESAPCNLALAEARFKAVADLGSNAAYVEQGESDGSA